MHGGVGKEMQKHTPAWGGGEGIAVPQPLKKLR